MVGIQAGGLTLSGVSVGGFQTTINVKELGLTLDVGGYLPEIIKGDHLFISHCHPDHCGCLISWLGTRRLLNMNTATIFAPLKSAAGLNDFIHAWEKIQNVTLDYRIFGLAPGAVMSVKQNLTITAIAMDHPIETIGFLLENQVKKLKPEFMHLTGRQIEAMKSQGRGGELFYIKPIQSLVYLPDTLPEVLDRLPPQVWEARVMILECTFLDDRKDLEKIRQGGHTTLDDILERLDRFRGDALVPFHFSRMYKKDEILEILDRRCTPTQRNRLIPFV